MPVNVNDSRNLPILLQLPLRDGEDLVVREITRRDGTKAVDIRPWVEKDTYHGPGKGITIPADLWEKVSKIKLAKGAKTAAKKSTAKSTKKGAKK